MSKENNENFNINTQPPKRDNRVVILLSVILVVLFALIIAVVAMNISMKNKDLRDSADKVLGYGTPTQSTVTVYDSTKIDSVTQPSKQNETTSEQTSGKETITTNFSQQTSVNSGSSSGEQPKKLTKADVIKLLNETTTAAAKGTYKVNRGGKFIKNIDFGSATGTLNKIIQGVDKNADLNSVVGGFLGIKKDPITGTATNGKCDGVDGKYLLKGMALTDSDVTDFSVNGNIYIIRIKNSNNPKANSAIAHATNDYITFAEINKGIFDSIGNAVKIVEGESSMNYTNIILRATIVDGKLTELEYSYTLNAKLKIQLAVIGATGTGEAMIIGKYTNIKY